MISNIRFSSHYGTTSTKLKALNWRKMKDPKAIPTILGRNIGISTCQGLTLQTRFNSTICIGSPYPQVAALLTWAKANPHMLLRRDVGRFDMLPPTTMTNSEEHSVISIAELATTPSVHLTHLSTHSNGSLTASPAITFTGSTGGRVPRRSRNDTIQ